MLEPELVKMHRLRAGCSCVTVVTGFCGGKIVTILKIFVKFLLFLHKLKEQIGTVHF